MPAAALLLAILLLWTGPLLAQPGPEGAGATSGAEGVRAERTGALLRMLEQSSADPARRAAYGGLLHDLAGRPHTPDPESAEDTYRTLFLLLRDDPTVSAETLLEVIRSMVAAGGLDVHVRCAEGAVALAERKAFFREAEALVRQGFERGRRALDRDRPAYGTQGDFEAAHNWMEGTLYDALGWVYFHEGRLDEAEAQLLLADSLNPGSETILYHLGRLYEARGGLTRAAACYARGLAAPAPGANPNAEALQALYARQHGGREGFARYLARLAEADRARRKAQVLGTRAEAPGPLAPFRLATLQGTPFSSAALEGRIAVLHFWGVWCAWCVREMPDLQRLHTRYEADPDVVLLTINNDDDPAAVRQWMQEHGYRFPVLLDDGFVRRIGIHAFPTTLFLDRKGRIAFVQEGWTEELVEEFGWRIEALREAGAD